MLDLAETTGTNAEVLDRVEAFFAAIAERDRQPRAFAGCANCSRSRRPPAFPRTASRSTSASAAGSITTPAPFTKPSSPTCPASVQRLQRRPVRQPRQQVHEAGASRRRGVARPRPAHRRDGGTETPAAHRPDDAGRRCWWCNFDAARLGDYQRIARQLRAAGVNVEVYPDAKKVGQQLAYAEKRGFKLAVIAGPDEFEQGVWKVKDLAKREEVTVPEAELVEHVRTSSLAATRQPSASHDEPRQPLRGGVRGVPPRTRGVAVVAVDEARRSYLDDDSVKSPDFLVVGPHDARLVVDVKGRKFPGGPAEQPPRRSGRTGPHARTSTA